MTVFKYDQLLSEEDICNLHQERKKIESYLNRNRCIRVFGRRNFGKSSLVKNVIAKHWYDKNPKKRLVLYVDFYPVKNEESANRLLTKCLNEACPSGKPALIPHIFSSKIELRRVFSRLPARWRF